MKILEVARILNAEVIAGHAQMEHEVHCAGASDMHSVTLARGCKEMLLLTGQLTPQTVRTCILSDISSVVVVRSLDLSPEVLELAREKQLILLKTGWTLYETCGKLYAAGLPSLSC